MRIAFYARVSSEEQVQGYSIDAQLRAGRDMAQSKGAEFVPYVEEGRSARTEDIRKRPVFKQMMADADAGRVDAIAVHKLDRFSRNLRITLESFERLGKANVAFLSITEQIDYTTPMGKLFLHMIGAIAQWYSDNLSQETKKGKKERKAQGLYNGLLPFGVVKAADGLPIPDRRDLSHDGHTTTNYDGLLLAFQESAHGLSDAQIATLLNAKGYRTTGNRGKNLFTKDTVRMILINRFYLGELPDGKADWLQGKHQGIVDAELFENAQRARARNFKRANKQNRKARVYSFSGMASCYYCGGSVHIHENKGERPRLYCYARTQGAKDCTARGTFLETYERQIENHLESFEIPANYQADILEMERKLVSNYSDVEAERTRLQNRLGKIKDLYGWGDMPKEDYLAEREQLQQRLSVLAPADDRTRMLEFLASFVRQVPQSWREATQEQRNRLMRKLFEEVLIKDDQVVAVKPRPEFAPFFHLDDCQGGRSRSGSDGIRIRDKYLIGFRNWLKQASTSANSAAVGAWSHHGGSSGPTVPGLR